MNVDIDEDDSEEATVNSGVSQGTVLCRLHQRPARYRGLEILRTFCGRGAAELSSTLSFS